jgi:hypothetical protein
MKDHEKTNGTRMEVGFDTPFGRNPRLLGGEGVHFDRLSAGVRRGKELTLIVLSNRQVRWTSPLRQAQCNA